MATATRNYMNPQNMATSADYSLDNTVLSASSLCSDTVKNAAGETLGNIKEIMISPSNHKIKYYVLSFGGFLGMGDKLFAIPPEALHFDTARKCAILNVDKEVLKNAEGFDKDNWPNMADPLFNDRTYNHYGLKYNHNYNAHTVI